ncbi:hypothetical protein D3C73_1373410 [compost metagenome]
MTGIFDELSQVQRILPCASHGQCRSNPVNYLVFANTDGLVFYRNIVEIILRVDNDDLIIGFLHNSPQLCGKRRLITLKSE